MSRIYKVCVLNTNKDVFDYYAKQHIPSIGSRVIVPFRNKSRIGIVTAISEKPEKAAIKLKSIESVIDKLPIISPEILSLCHWISDYYHASLSNVIALALPKLIRTGKSVALQQDAAINSKITNKDSPALNQAQSFAVNSILSNEHQFQAFLLHGITGSGKTEVYLHCINHVLNQNKQALLIVPEIGLTPQLLARFSKEIIHPIGVVHSQITDKTRAELWLGAKEGKIRLIIGTRTAIFTPMPNLGLIIIDEEHDSSLKQMQSVRYSARDAALVRAKSKKIPVVLGSATPSLESQYNAQHGKYILLELKQRAVQQSPTHYQLIDIRNQSLKEGLSKQALNLIEDHLSKKQQVLVFINRRGYAPVILCQQCGWIADCTACDCHLTLHKKEKSLLVCHHCGRSQALPANCSQCNNTDLVPVGLGTQRIFETLTQLFPTIKAIRIDRDETARKNTLKKYLDDIHNGKIQLIVGTQMLAKGHDFANLSLVVILDTDNGFCHPDFRALEQLGQLITQVSGRAGRTKTTGEVAIQTYMPEHPLLNLLIKDGFIAFSNALMAMRKQACLPPYYFLALVRAHAKSEEKVNAFMQLSKQKVQQYAQNLTILGPAPAPIARKSYQYHKQLLLKSPVRAELQSALSKLEKDLAKATRLGVIWDIDVDPLVLS